VRVIAAPAGDAVRDRQRHQRDQGAGGGVARALRVARKRGCGGVRIDGVLIEPEPVSELPMAQRYFLF